MPVPDDDMTLHGPESAVTDQFRGGMAASRGGVDDSWIKELVARSSSPAALPAATPTLASPPGSEQQKLPNGSQDEETASPTAAPSPAQPFGVRVAQAFSNVARGLVDEVAGGEQGVIPRWVKEAKPLGKFANMDYGPAYLDAEGQDHPLDGTKHVLMPDGQVYARTPELEEGRLESLGRLLGVGMLAPAGDVAKGAKAAEEGAAGAEKGTAAGDAGAASADAAKTEAPTLYTLGDQKVTPYMHAPQPAEDVTRDAQRFLNGDAAKNPVQNSLLTLSDDGLTDKVTEQLARFIPDKAVKPDDILHMNAYSFATDPDAFLANFRSRFPDLDTLDEHQGAWAMLINGGSQQVAELAKSALASGAPEDFEKFMAGFQVQNRMIGAFENAGTAMGRAMRARQQAWDHASQFDVSMQDLFKNGIAGAEPQDLAQRISDLADAAKVNPFVSMLRQMSGRDAFLYGWYNLLLSNPAIFAKKAASDISMLTVNLASRYAAEKFGAGPAFGGVAPGETAALLSGYIGSVGDAFRTAGRALQAGRGQFAAEQQYAFDGAIKTRLSMLANGAAPALDAAQPTANLSRYLAAALPTSWMGAVDDFAKMVNFRGEARALAYRDNYAKFLSENGAVDHAGLNQALAETMTNMPPALRERAVAAAKVNTFQEPLDHVSETLTGWVDKFNIPLGRFELPMGRMILAFTKIPMNIARQAYRFSPAPFALKSQAVRETLAAGGADADLLKARAALGTAFTLSMLGYAASGALTGRGPANPTTNTAWRAAGNRPYSLFGAQYRYAEPLGTVIAPIADTADLLRFAPDDATEGQVLRSLVFGVGNSLLSMSPLAATGGFLDALQNPVHDGDRWIKQLVGSLAVPSGVNAIERGADQWQRAHYDLLDSVAARVPGWAEDLPQSRDRWGDPIPLDQHFLPFWQTLGLPGGIARAVSPFSLAPDASSVQPIDKWIWDNRTAFPNFGEGRVGVAKLPRILSEERNHFTGRYQLSPEQLEHYQILAGNGLKDESSGLGARDTLNALVQGDHPDAWQQRQWNEGSPEDRAQIVLRIVSWFRSAATKQMQVDYPEIRAALDQQFGDRANQAAAGRGGAAASGKAPTLH